MSASKPIVEHIIDVGPYTVLVTIGAPHPQTKVAPFVTEWQPTRPPSLSPVEQREYAIGCAVALARLSQVIGGAVAVIEPIRRKPETLN